MLIIFTVNDQKVTHDLGQRTLVAGSSGVVKAAFTFDNSWDGLDSVTFENLTGVSVTGVWNQASSRIEF